MSEATVKEGNFRIDLEYFFGPNDGHKYGPRLLYTEVYVVNEDTNERFFVDRRCFLDYLVRQAHVDWVPVGMYIPLKGNKTFVDESWKH